jgi:hypothetical protein
MKLQPRTWNIRCSVCLGTGIYELLDDECKAVSLQCVDCHSTGLVKSIPRGDCRLQWWVGINVNGAAKQVKCWRVVPLRSGEEYAFNIASTINRRVLVLRDSVAIFMAVPRSYYGEKLNGL